MKEKTKYIEIKHSRKWINVLLMFCGFILGYLVLFSLFQPNKFISDETYASVGKLLFLTFAFSMLIIGKQWNFSKKKKYKVLWS